MGHALAPAPFSPGPCPDSSKGGGLCSLARTHHKGLIQGRARALVNPSVRCPHNYFAGGPCCPLNAPPAQALDCTQAARTIGICQR